MLVASWINFTYYSPWSRLKVLCFGIHNAWLRIHCLFYMYSFFLMTWCYHSLYDTEFMHKVLHIKSLLCIWFVYFKNAACFNILWFYFTEFYSDCLFIVTRNGLYHYCRNAQRVWLKHSRMSQTVHMHLSMTLLASPTLSSISDCLSFCVC